MLTLLFAALCIFIFCCDDKIWSCKGLTENLSNIRWLSAPYSRIVLNYAEVVNQPVKRPISEALTLNAACFVGSEPVRTPMLWALDSDIFKVTQAAWSPHKIVAQAEAQGIKIQTTTCLTDNDTISQLIQIQEAKSDSLIIKGKFDAGSVRWDVSHNALILDGDNLAIIVKFSEIAKWLGCDSGNWSVELNGINAGDEIVVAAHYVINSNIETATEWLLADPAFFAEELNNREVEWDAILAKVPHPMDFNLHTLKREVSSEDIERTYYRAWVFVMSDILPPMPENDYNYPQLACGKPSLWNEGHPKALPSAQWESFIAMQFAGLVHPDTAWAAFEGMMTLVDEAGSMGGEGLPSRHAQTAWVLYSLTGETERLRSTYPALKRMLLWKALDPRWIYSGATREHSKDAEFVAHALIDMVYATRIASVLNMPEEKDFWQEQIDKLSMSYKEWFWETPGGFPFEFYFADKDYREPARSTWCLQGMVLPLEILGEDQRDSLLKAFRHYFDKERAFLITALTKHPTYNFTMHGVWQYGTPDEVAMMTEAVMCTITLAGEFGEEYTDYNPIHCTGVTPSIFGAANIIDATLWHNGIILGHGLPIVAHVPNAKGVKNLMIRGKILDVRFDEADVEIDGSALEVLKPAGDCCESCGRCTLGVGEQIVFEVK